MSKSITSFQGNFNFSVNGNTKGSKNFAGMSSSLKHTLRIEKIQFGKVDKNNSNVNFIQEDIGNNLFIVDDKIITISKPNDDAAIEIHNNILLDIEKNIQSTIITDEDLEKERLSQLKSRSNLKSRISKKWGTDKFDVISLIEKNQDKSPEKLYDFLLKKQGITERPKIYKPAVNQIKSYIETLKQPITKQYKNETILKEIIFKVPDHNDEKEIDQNILFQIHKNVVEKMYKGHKIALMSYHGDEGNGHIHTNIHGYNDITKSFNIIETEHKYIIKTYLEEIKEDLKKVGIKENLTEETILKMKQHPKVLKVLGEYKQKSFRDLSNEILIKVNLKTEKIIYSSPEEEQEIKKKFEEDNKLKEKGLSPYNGAIKRKEEEIKTQDNVIKIQEETILKNTSKINNIDLAEKFISNLIIKEVPKEIEEVIITELHTSKEWLELEIKQLHKELFNNKDTTLTNEERGEKFDKMTELKGLIKTADDKLKILNPSSKGDTPPTQREEDEEVIFNSSRDKLPKLSTDIDIGTPPPRKDRGIIVEDLEAKFKEMDDNNSNNETNDKLDNSHHRRR